MTSTETTFTFGDSDDLREAAEALRLEVFVDEQGVPEDEVIDGQNDNAIQLVATSGDETIATARLLDLGDRVWRIGLVAVARSKRGQGLGARTMRAAMEYIVSQGGEEAVLDAQSDALAFYRRLGFEQAGDEQVFESGFVLVPMSHRF